MNIIGENKGWTTPSFSNEPAHFVYANGTSACGKTVGRDTRWPIAPANVCLRCKRIVVKK